MTVRVVKLNELHNQPMPRRQSFLFDLTLISLLAIFLGSALYFSVSLFSHIGNNRSRGLYRPHKLGVHTNVNMTIPLNQLMPEQADLGDLLINKLTSLPPPTADCSAVACIALTFDDGPDPASTPAILDALKHENVQATFFLIGNRVQNGSSLVRRMYDEGNLVENHSWSHPDFIKLNAIQTKQQVESTQAVITGLGLPAPLFFRPPYGNRSNITRQNVGLPIIMWNVDPKDWHETDPNRIVELVEAQAKPGAIILMHDRVATSQALPKILLDLKQKYRLVTVSELLNLAPGAHGEYYGR